MGFIGTTEVMPCYKAPIACACIGFSAACNAQAHFVNFIGPAEAVPLVTEPLRLRFFAAGNAPTYFRARFTAAGHRSRWVAGRSRKRPFGGKVECSSYRLPDLVD